MDVACLMYKHLYEANQATILLVGLGLPNTIWGNIIIKALYTLNCLGFTGNRLCLREKNPQVFTTISPI